MAVRNFAANLKIGAVMSSTVGRVFGGLKAKIKDQEAVLKKLRAEFKAASKGSGEFAGSLDKLKGDIAEAEAKLKKLKAAANFDIGKSLRGVGTKLGGDLKRLGVAAGVAGAAIVGVGASIYTVTRGFVDWADDIGDSAEALNMSTQALQTWQFAAGTVGVGGAKMTASIAKFSKTVAEGGDATDEALGKLGLNAARLRKLGLDQQLVVVAEAFKDYKGDIPPATLAMKLFGRSGYQLAGILKRGEEGMRDFRRQGEQLGAILNDEAAAKAGEAASALDMFGLAMTGLRNTIAIEFVPVLRRLGERFTKLIKDNGPKIREWATRFATVIETKVVPALGKFLDRLPAIIDQVGAAADKFWTGLTAVKDFVGGWDNLAIALVALNFAPTILAIGSMAKAVWAMSGATAAAVAPWVALAAAVGAVWWLWSNPDKVIEGLNSVFGEERVNEFGMFWAKIFNETEQWFYRTLDESDKIREKLKAMWGETVEWFKTKWGEATDFINNSINRIKAEMDLLAKTIREAFTGVFDWIGTKFDELLAKASNLGSKIKGFFSFGFGGKETSMNTAPTVAPPDSMPARDRATAQNNTVNIKVDAPGQDGLGIARQLRQELNRKPLFDTDGALVPG